MGKGKGDGKALDELFNYRPVVNAARRVAEGIAQLRGLMGQLESKRLVPARPLLTHNPPEEPPVGS